MAILQLIQRIAALDWERDEENAGGYVAAISKDDLPALTQRFEAAGYDVSDSRDEEGCYLWVKAPAGAIAYKYADPAEDARWVYDESDLADIRREDPSLIVEVEA